jgi:succinoglycan biosynthesis protein ExoO
LKPEAKLLCVSRYLAGTAATGHNAYLKAVLEALRNEGFQIEYFWVDGPAWFRPWYRVPSTALKVDRLHERVGIRCGEWVLATSPRLWLAGIVLVFVNKGLRYFPGVFSGMMRNLQRRAEGVFAREREPISANTSEPSATEQAAFSSLLRERQPQAVLLNYAYLAPLADTARAAGVPSAVLTHDLVHRLGATLARRGIGTNHLTEESEANLLRRADLLIAIQVEEAEELRRLLPGSEVITVPMPQEVTDSVPPPDDGPMLFVGSATEPNRDGIEWFLKQVWPGLHAAVPAAKLRVCGTVCTQLAPAPEGVELAGVVPNLAVEYARAALVIAPLLAGSGLKIKVAEALAHGRAVVATSFGLQGLSKAEGLCASRADNPDDFAGACCRILGETKVRRQMSQDALQFARRHFSPKACVSPVVAWVNGLERSGGQQVHGK